MLIYAFHAQIILVLAGLSEDTRNEEDTLVTRLIDHHLQDTLEGV